MLKKLTIRNFKAIQDMTIEFTPLTVLIGGNSCGKSTILQALDFLRASSFRDIPEYLREKGWKIEELKSQINNGQHKPIEFVSVYEFLIDEKKELLCWTFQIDHDEKKWIINEKLESLTTKEKIYSSGFENYKPMIAGNHDAFAGAPNAIAHDIREINLQSSWLKYIETDQKNSLFALKNFLTESAFFGLLSPDSIRKGKEQISDENIGQNGINLATFIHSMSPEDREYLNKGVSKFIESKIKIETVDIGKKIDFFIEEKFGILISRINKDHISDGLLRLIAFAALYLQKYINNPYHGFILLDEIENGINPYMTEQIVSLLREINEKQKRQIIVTTHSPVILNNFNQEEIIFLWKDNNGSVYSRKFFESDEMKSLLEALNPGEVWINLEKEDILERLSIKKEGKE